MDNTGLAITILAILILLYLFPTTRPCITKGAPWLALVGGAFAVGLLLTPGAAAHAREGGTRGGGEPPQIGGASSEAPASIGSFIVDSF